MDGLSEGRIVHYTLSEGVCRPAIIVNAWDGKLDEGKVNLQVFVDGRNDSRTLAALLPGFNPDAAPGCGTLWRTSVRYSEAGEADTWHWPERK